MRTRQKIQKEMYIKTKEEATDQLDTKKRKLQALAITISRRYKKCENGRKQNHIFNTNQRNSTKCWKTRRRPTIIHPT